MSSPFARRRAIFWSVALGMLVLDQASKEVTRRAFAEGEAFPLWPNVFELTLAYNKGIAFGMLQGAGVFLTPVAILIAGAAAWHSMRHPRESVWMHTAMGLLAAGAIGNLIDRLWLGKVTDMFWFRLINFPVFNVADSCITVATVMLILGWGREPKPKPAERPDSEAAAS
jgi:signal peptidase II